MVSVRETIISITTQNRNPNPPGFDPLPPGKEARVIRCKNLALYIRDCESLCLSDETLTAVGPFYLVSMPGEVKYPTQGVNW